MLFKTDAETIGQTNYSLHYHHKEPTLAPWRAPTDSAHQKARGPRYRNGRDRIFFIFKEIYGQR